MNTTAISKQSWRSISHSPVYGTVMQIEDEESTESTRLKMKRAQRTRDRNGLCWGSSSWEEVQRNRRGVTEMGGKKELKCRV